MTAGGSVATEHGTTTMIAIAARRAATVAADLRAAEEARVGKGRESKTKDTTHKDQGGRISALVEGRVKWINIKVQWHIKATPCGVVEPKNSDKFLSSITRREIA